MTHDTLPSFAALRRRYAVNRASPARADERTRLLQYLLQHGATASSPYEIYEAVLTLPHEEELSAFKCREGVAVSHASEGWMVLFRDGDQLVSARAQTMGAAAC